MNTDKRIPVVVLGGFLGAGKSTILNRLLKEPGVDARRVAVIVNEFGQTSIDHLMVETVVGDTTVLKNGCICCVIRDDLSGALHALLDRCSLPQGAAIDRVIIETTGLADPGPIAKTIAMDPLLGQQLRFSGVLCAVDAVQCTEQLRDFELCRKQIASADVVVVTKVDVASSVLVTAACRTIEGLNSTALVVCRNALVDPLQKCFDLITDSASQQKALLTGVRQVRPRVVRVAGNADAFSDIQSVSVWLCEPVDWVAFSVWLSAFVHCYASAVLRIKGVLQIKGAHQSVLINVVRSFIHPPDKLEGATDLPAGGTLVFIVTGVQAARIELSLRHFLGDGSMHR